MWPYRNWCWDAGPRIVAACTNPKSVVPGSLLDPPIIASIERAESDEPGSPSGGRLGRAASHRHGLRTLCRPKGGLVHRKSGSPTAAAERQIPFPARPAAKDGPFCPLSCELAVVWPRATAGWWRTRPRLLSTPLRAGTGSSSAGHRRSRRGDSGSVTRQSGEEGLRPRPGSRSPRTSGRSRRAVTNAVTIPTLPRLHQTSLTLLSVLGAAAGGLDRRSRPRVPWL